MKKIVTIAIVVLLLTTILVAGCADIQPAPVPATKENLKEGVPTLLDDGSCVIKENDVIRECMDLEKTAARGTCPGKCSQ